MVYECDQCHVPLPAGVTACPTCGEKFDDTVPADAEVPRKGFSPAPSSVSPPIIPSPAPLPHPAALSPANAPPVRHESHPPPRELLQHTHQRQASRQTPLTEQPLVVILAFLFCFPVGLVFLWLHPTWTRKSKLLITCLFAGCVLLGGIYNNSPQGKVEQAARDRADAVDAAEQKKKDAADAAAQAKTDAEEKAAKDRDGDPLAGEGEVGYLQIPKSDKKAIQVGATKDGLDAMMNATEAKDEVGFRQVFDRGEAFTLPAGTQAKLLGLDGFAVYHIRIVGGAHDAQKAWVPMEWLRKH